MIVMTVDSTRSGPGVGLAARHPVSGIIGSSKRGDTHIITLGENGFELAFCPDQNSGQIRGVRSESASPRGRLKGVPNR